MSRHEIRARQDDRTIRVYQAYSPEIADAALAAQTFVAPFQMGRMTWIKPSFNWMMYRSGFATKPGQERVLAIDIKRAGFEWALAHAALSSFIPGFHTSQESWKSALSEAPVRVQWDPERDWRLAPIADVRSLQIGLSGEAVAQYVADWIVAISDITNEVRRIEAAVRVGDKPTSHPDELESSYPLAATLVSRIVPQT